MSQTIRRKNFIREIQRRFAGFVAEKGSACVPGEIEVFSADTLKRWQRYCVYSWWRGDECLYVGETTQGLVRPLSRGHHRISFNSGDDLVLFWINDPHEASLRSVEFWLIHVLKPKFNGRTIEPGFLNRLIGECE